MKQLLDNKIKLCTYASSHPYWLIIQPKTTQAAKDKRFVHLVGLIGYLHLYPEYSNVAKVCQVDIETVQNKYVLFCFEPVNPNGLIAALPVIAQRLDALGAAHRFTRMTSEKEIEKFLNLDSPVVAIDYRDSPQRKPLFTKSLLGVFSFDRSIEELCNGNLETLTSADIAIRTRLLTLKFLGINPNKNQLFAPGTDDAVLVAQKIGLYFGIDTGALSHEKIKQLIAVFSASPGYLDKWLGDSVARRVTQFIVSALLQKPLGQGNSEFIALMAMIFIELNNGKVLVGREQFIDFVRNCARALDSDHTTFRVKNQIRDFLTQHTRLSAETPEGDNK